MDIETVEKLLTTTRSVRKRLDLSRPVEPEIIQKCLDIAIQAPTGSNQQGWHFVVVTDAEKRARIGELYKTSFEMYAGDRSPSLDSSALRRPGGIDQMRRVISSSWYLAENMGQVPVMIIPCHAGRVENAGQMMQAGFYGSILPAAWSLMLALRAHGIGAAWTTLHLRYEKEIAELLGIPENITQVALLPIAYYTGEDFQPAKRVSATEFTYWDAWGEKKST